MKLKLSTSRACVKGDPFPVAGRGVNLPCPACRELGHDFAGDNLRIFPSGKFHCIRAGRDKQHNRRIIDLMPELGIKRPAPASGPRCSTASKTSKRSAWPSFRKPSAKELAAISELRNVAVKALKIMAERGLLYTGTFPEGDAWIVTDARKINAQARLLSGGKWPKPIDAKAKTLPGSQAAWPIGLAEAKTYPEIALVEGGPDFISVLHHAMPERRESLVAPVMMAGAGMYIPREAIPLFTGKRVRIFVHDDEQGNKAAAQWASQLLTVGCKVDGFNFAGLVRSDGKPVKDLNDLCSIDCSSWEEHRDLIENALTLDVQGGK